MSDDVTTIMRQFLRQALFSLARLCLRRGIKIQEFSEAAKRAFIDAATDEIITGDEKPSTSKLAVITGLHRRDVTRLTSSDENSSGRVNLATRIIGQWQRDRRFLTKQGRPRALSFDGDTGEFVKLLHSVSSELSPYTVLFELERIGIVERRNGNVTLKKDVYIPEGNIEQSLSLLSRDTNDLVSAAEENIFNRPEKPNLHVATEYDNVPLEFLPAIRQWIMEKGVKLHAEAREFLAKFDKDINPNLLDKRGGARVSIASFSSITFPRASRGKETKQ